MKNKEKIIICVSIFILVVFGIFIYIKINDNKEKKVINTTDDIRVNINTDDSDNKIEWDKYQVKDIELESSLEITEEGIYKLSGNIDGCITVNTSGNVNLVLNGVNIVNSNGPAIVVEEAKNVLITLSDGSSNYLEDSPSYNGYDGDINSVIYSKDDIIFDGNGKLEIKANYQDGIVSKDDLKIISGTYVINSNDDGIRGKDSVYIIDGSFTIDSLGDGITSVNDIDSDKGFILIENGNFNIKTGGGSSNSSTMDSWGKWGYSYSSDTSSAKGLKSVNDLVIENGNFIFDTSDDAIHSNNYVGIKNGSFDISSGDDGIHADTEIIIDGGKINITRSYEGIESSKITINNGDVSVVASDDGINVAGGNDSSSMNRPGENNYSFNSDNKLIINDGKVYVNASGDGIDINGSGYIYGGEVIVDGPSNDGNGSLDYDKEFIVNGGIFIAVGTSGMAQSISSNSTQYNLFINLNNSCSSDKLIEILDIDGNIIISHTSIKNFSLIVVSSSELKKNNTYTLKIDGEEYTSFTISDITTIIGNTHMNGGMPGGNGGGRPGGRR